ncbi:MAG: hypothetical protein ABF893_17545 [Gluconacetobacter liquefaciens]
MPTRDPIEIMERRLASLTRRISTLENDALMTRQLLVTFLVNQMPLSTTDADFHAKLDAFFSHATSELVDDEDRSRGSAQAAALELLRRQLGDAWSEQRWKPTWRKQAVMRKPSATGSPSERQTPGQNTLTLRLKPDLPPDSAG